MEATLADSFWRKVDIRSQEECWNWLGAKASFGYGEVVVEGVRKRAHRVAYELSSGETLNPFPADNVLHHCDNPLCCNPSHLFKGTSHDNHVDSRNKNRGFPQKLNWILVREIRKRASESKFLIQTELAREFGVSQTTIYRITNNLTWKE